MPNQLITTIAAQSESIAGTPLVIIEPQNRAYFEYKIKGTSEWLRLEFQTDIESTDDFEKLVEALDYGTEYEFRSAYGKDSPTYYGSVEEFKTEFLHAFLGQSDGEGIEPSPTVSIVINAEVVNTDAETFITTQNISNLIITGIAITDAFSLAPLIEVDISHERINAPIVNTDDDPIVPELIVHKSEWLTTLPPPDTDAEGIVPNVGINRFIAPPVAESDSDSVFVMVAPYVEVLSYIEYKKQGEELWETTNIAVLEESGSFSFDSESLDPGTTYEFRAVGEQETTLYGETLTFLTPFVLIDELAEAASEGIAPFIPEHSYNYPQPAESEGNGTTPEIHTEFPFNIGAPITTSQSNAVITSLTIITNVRLTRIADGVIRAEWKFIPTWSGTISHYVYWHNRSLHIELLYRLNLMDDLSNVQTQQFLLQKPGGGTVFPDVMELIDNNKLKLIFEDYYVYMPETVLDEYEAESKTEALVPTIIPISETDNIPQTARAGGVGILPAVSGAYNMILSYEQSTNPILRLKDFYGDDVDSPENHSIKVTEELYEVTFLVRLEMV